MDILNNPHFTIPLILFVILCGVMLALGNRGGGFGG